MKTIFRHFRQVIFEGLASVFGQPLQLPDAPLVVVAPHPDDEVFGTGGLIALMASRGLPVHILMLTDGGGSHRGCCALEERETESKRRELSGAAATVLGCPVDTIRCFGRQDGTLPHPGDAGFDELATEMADRLQDINPTAILAPHPLEGWRDHVAAELLTRAAITKLARPVPLMHYCVWFWFSMALRKAFRIDWRQARILDITDVHDRKAMAMKLYLNAKAPCGNPWIGKLPLQLLKRSKSKKELFFEATH